MRHRLALALLVTAALTACTGNAQAERVQLAVTVDAAGDRRQERAMQIADRYAPGGTFTIEHKSTTQVSTSGSSSPSGSTVVVFEATGDMEAIVARLNAEPHVLAVDER